jgi:predicted porin
MKKTLIALAVAGVIAAPAAMAEVSVYGVAHVSVDRSDYKDWDVNNDGEDNDDKDLTVTSRASRVGVKAAEDLGDGLKAVAQMEFQVDMADEKAEKNLSARNQIVGLAGGFGTVALGRHDTPYKMSTGSLDVFADTAADYNAIIGMGGLENRGDNVIAYLSPDMNGLSVQAAVVAAENSEDTTAATSVAVQYKAGPLFAAAAMESFEDTGAGATLNKGVSGTRLGVGYDLGAAKVGFVYESATDADFTFIKAANGNPAVALADDDYTAMLVNAAIPMGSNTIIAEYGSADWDGADDDITLMAVGVSHSFSKASSGYVAYGNVDAGDASVGIITAGLVTKF